MTTYRGIKVTKENLHVEKAKSQGGIYRGVKHDAIKSVSSKGSKQGIYRGTRWVA